MTPSPQPDVAQPPLRTRIHRWGVQNPKVYYIFPPSIWAVAIYILSVIRVPDVSAPEGLGLLELDKVVHFVLYAVLSLLLLRGWQREKMPPIGLHGFVFLLCMVFGLMIEMTQSITPHRSFEVGDLVADAIGTLTGQVAWHLLMVRYGKRTRLYPGLFRPDFKDSPANPANRKSGARAGRAETRAERRDG